MCLTACSFFISGELEKSKEDPGRAARTAFGRSIYPKSHPSYVFTPDEEIEFVRKLTTSDLRAYHERLIGLGSVNLVLVGDLPGSGAEKVEESVKRHLADWRQVTNEIPSDYERGKLQCTSYYFTIYILYLLFLQLVCQLNTLQ